MTLIFSVSIIIWPPTPPHPYVLYTESSYPPLIISQQRKLAEFLFLWLKCKILITLIWDSNFPFHWFIYWSPNNPYPPLTLFLSHLYLGREFSNLRLLCLINTIFQLPPISHIELNNEKSNINLEFSRKIKLHHLLRLLIVMRCLNNILSEHVQNKI